MNRRTFLKTGAATAVAAGGGWRFASPVAASEMASPRSGQKPRNIIFLVSDGMSSGTLSIADQYLRWRDGRPSHWIRLYEEGKVTRGLMDTASLNNIVTDSAAAASAWGCGHRVNNDSVNIGPDGEVYEPLLVTAKKLGKATGLVTTATVTHATPAGFAANVSRRWHENGIAVQYIEREIDLLLGGGRNHFDPSHRNDERDLLGESVEAGYKLVTNRSELQSAAANGATQMLGLFADGHIPYELDRIHDDKLAATVPSLADMTRAGLRVLNQNPNGFVVQIEGARVDHAAHSNDVGGLVFDQLAFDDAVGEAVEFAEAAGDTLVIVTTDHGNGNPGLNSGWQGGRYRFEVLSRFVGTHDAIFSRIDEESSLGTIWEVIGEVTKADVTRERAKLLQDALQGRYEAPYHRSSTPGVLLGQILANETDIGWAGRRHTSDHVELAALGPGSDGIRAFMKNTDVYDLMVNTWA